MKYKIATSIFLAIVIVGTGFGQNVGSKKLERKQKGDKRFIKLADDLGLAPDQKKDLYELMEEERPVKRARRGERPSQDERLAARSEFNQKVADILDEDQMEGYLALQAKRAERRQKRKAKKEEKRAYKKANIDTVLKEQRAKLDDILTVEERAIITKIRDAKGQENEGKRRRGRLSREDRQSLKTIAANHKDDIRGLMDEIADQKAKWKADMMEMSSNEKAETDKKKKKENRRGEKKRKRGKKEGAAGFLLLDPNN